MLSSKAKIGIWGFGVVGQSIARYLAKSGYADLMVHDVKDVGAHPLLRECRAVFVAELADLLEGCDFVFPGPGIDLELYQAYSAKFISELDLFYQQWQKPIIAITGTLGKTTLTTLLANILNQCGIRAIAAGNVGLAMCDILDSDYELVVLELSSFQLESCRFFAPDIAIWTNLYPNHLDRHKTMHNYFAAKAKVFLHQHANQIALLPTSLMSDLKNLQIPGQCYFFGEMPLDIGVPNYVKGVFTRCGADIILQAGAKQIKIANIAALKKIDTYEINLVALAAVFYLQQIILPPDLQFRAIAHRVEKFYTNRGIDFYNDSKSTVAQATLAAVQKLTGRPIILFLGGLSKGVDRASLVQNLKGSVQLIICFGGEAEALHAMCAAQQITSAKFVNLESAFDYCLEVAKTGDQVLFSPAGSSFDLFANYVERGEVFKRLVLAKYI